MHVHLFLCKMSVVKIKTKYIDAVCKINLHVWLQRSSSFVKAPGEENCLGRLKSQSAAVSQLSAAEPLPKL